MSLLTDSELLRPLLGREIASLNEEERSIFHREYREGRAAAVGKIIDGSTFIEVVGLSDSLATEISLLQEIARLNAVLADFEGQSVVRSVLFDIVDEYNASRVKHPLWPTDVVHAAAVVAEESGELTRASLQYTYEPLKANLGQLAEEAVQTGAMALRFLVALRMGQYEARRSPMSSQPEAPRL